MLRRNSATDPARVPPRLLGGKKTPNLLKSRIFCAFSDFIMQRCGVNRSSRAETTATPRVQSALARRAGSAGESTRATGSRERNQRRRVQFIFDRSDRIAIEVPPSDAKLRLNCRLLDGFVGIPAILTRAKPCASFCGMRPIGAPLFLNWANAALILRVWR
jgi:hypothetical protein